MGRIRHFTKDDIPRVIELNTKLFPNSARLSLETQRFNFTEVCFNNPWFTDDIQSLVYEYGAGKVV